ncbi:BlaI/MecI/CopY family transcriptional regulator [Massilia sp. B-10]|nr:BlaI/MecI/CopY family transcriptional regulator [Massilia sp. B-10]
MLRHRVDGQRYLYSAVVPKQKVRESALKRLVGTFFDNSTASAATALLGMSGKLSAEELDALGSDDRQGPQGRALVAGSDLLVLLLKHTLAVLLVLLVLRAAAPVGRPARVRGPLRHGRAAAVA